jgi:hypothetical protein
MSANRPISTLFVEEHKAYHGVMGETYLPHPSSGPADRSTAADAFLREEPDEEEDNDEQDEEDDRDEQDDDVDEGYSE